MGILDGALAGLGKGIADAGGMMIQHGMNQESMRQQAEYRSILEERSSELAMKREEAKMRLQQEYADRARGQRSEAIRGGLDFINDDLNQAEAEYQQNGTLNAQTKAHLAKTKEQRMQEALRDPKKVQQGLIASGYYDDARALEGVGKGTMHNAPFGTDVIDEEGNVLYAGSENRLAIENERTALMREKAKKTGIVGGAAAPKPEDIDKRISSARKIVGEYTKGKKNPYLFDADDEPYTRLLSEVVEPVAIQGGSAHQAAQQAKKALDQYDTQVRKYADSVADSMFDKKGKLKRDDMADSFAESGLSVGNKDEFKHSLRESLMTVPQFKKFYQNPEDEKKRLAARAKMYQAKR